LARLREDASAEMERTLKRVLLSMLAVVALAMFALWRIDSPRLESLRMRVADQARPLLEVTALPLAKAVTLIEDWERFSVLHTQNRDLRREIARLRSWREAARQLERENARLRALNNVRLSPRLTFTTAEVIADPRGPFGRSVLVSAGTADGLLDGSAVIDGSGLVGRLVGVGENVSRALLLTDFASRVPVKVLPGGERGILSGDGTGAPRLDFIADPGAVSLGARVVTSGDDGVFPPDLPVGVIGQAEGRVIRVGLAADFQLLDFVRILRWRRDAPSTLAPDLVSGPPETGARSDEAAEPVATGTTADAEADGAERAGGPALPSAAAATLPPIAQDLTGDAPRSPRPATRPGE
jgi:rod shape-determining protein MreC